MVGEEFVDAPEIEGAELGSEEVGVEIDDRDAVDGPLNTAEDGHKFSDT